jgi:membrane protease YdiL (CAAX protease family)
MVYLVQGCVFLAAALWVWVGLGFDLKRRFSDFEKSAHNDIKLGFKYFSVYLSVIVAVIILLVLVVMALIKMGLITEAALQFLETSTVHSNRLAEKAILLETIRHPVKFLILLFVECVLIPVEEEMMHRRFLYVALRQKMLFLPALLLSSVIFGIVHLSGAVAAFLSGLFLCWMYEKHQNLPSNIMVHGLINLSITLALIFVN